METGYFNSVIRLILILKLTFQIKDVNDDGVLIINFYSQTGDGWHATSTSHTILESDVLKKNSQSRICDEVPYTNYIHFQRSAMICFLLLFLNFRE